MMMMVVVVVGLKETRILLLILPNALILTTQISLIKADRGLLIESPPLSHKFSVKHCLCCSPSPPILLLIIQSYGFRGEMIDKHLLHEWAFNSVHLVKLTGQLTEAGQADSLPHRLAVFHFDQSLCGPIRRHLVIGRKAVSRGQVEGIRKSWRYKKSTWIIWRDQNRLNPIFSWKNFL